MLRKINPLETASWKKLQLHFEAIGQKKLTDFFTEDPSRASEFSMQWEDIFVDFSKTHVKRETVRLLVELARESGLEQGIRQLFEGAKINETEKRSVLHSALRNRSNKPIVVDGKDVMPEINQVLEQISVFSHSIRNGDWKGFTSKPIKNLVNIGIGGSDLGPVMVCNALKHYASPNTKVFFVSNVDGTHMAETLKDLDAEETLFMIVSKTFTTQETMANANTARDWFLSKGGAISDIPKHFVAVSTNTIEVEKFGIDTANMFRFWDFVGGRFSLWSAVGLSIACYAGFENFSQLLDGAYAMDEHFRTTAFDENLPILLALSGIWYTNFYNCSTEAILPYDQYLDRFPAYLQQAVMESNGKYVDRNGEEVPYATSAVLWGEPGTNGQHSFYQLIHQGTQMIPCIFLAGANPLNSVGNHHNMLLSNFFAQPEALMKGKSKVEVLAEFKSRGVSEEDAAALAPFKVFKGNVPSISILYERLTPFTLGALVALFEHRIFVQGHIWNIYSYDQWGVELGKQLANAILPELEGKQAVLTHDASTNLLINKFKEMRKA
jgi:glucose-6-phosphate isomerase